MFMAWSTAADAGNAFPVREDVHGEIIDRRDELGMLEPDIPHLGGGYRDRDLALHSLDLLDQILHAGPLSIRELR